MNWLHIREIKLIKEERFSIFIKTVHNNDEDKEINIKKRGKPSEELFSKYLKKHCGRMANLLPNLNSKI